MLDDHGILRPELARAYALGGSSRMTLVGEKTGQRFTYRIERAESEDGAPKNLYFVSVLKGPDNTSDYTYLGILVPNHVGGGYRYVHGRKSSISSGAPSVRAFEWCWPRLEFSGQGFRAWHDGHCARCRRRLTTPESVARGLGPECAGKIAEGAFTRAA